MQLSMRLLASPFGQTFTPPWDKNMAILSVCKEKHVSIGLGLEDFAVCLANFALHLPDKES